MSPANPAPAPAPASASASASAPASAAPLSPAHVGRSFVAVYYGVMFKFPARLPDLYGADSELHHGPSHVAHGLTEIAARASDLPLANSDAHVVTLSAQVTATGGYVVTVLGTFEKNDNPAALFAQTFILEKQSESHDDHFFCRNDLFLDLSVAPLPPNPPLNVKDPNPTAKPIIATAQTDTATPPVEVAPADLPTDIPIPPPAVSDAPPVRPEIPDEPRSLPDVVPAPLPHLNVNGPASEAVHVASEAQPAPAEGSTQPQSPLSANSAIPNAGPVVDDDAVEQPAVPRPSAAKKTWASIVSSKEEADAAAAAKESAAAVHATNGMNEDVPKQIVEDASAQPPVNEQVENIPPRMDAETSAKGGVASSGQQPRGGSGVQNGQRPNHLGNRGHQRTFGPSAVVQLASLSPSQLQDTRALSSDLREEFGQYGFKLRHVEVKAQKGIAFIEYESAEGVRAAVAAWANGARDQGIFAGIPLNVSEKRPYNKWRPGSTRGGRGGARGGRRNRPASTPIS